MVEANNDGQEPRPENEEEEEELSSDEEEQDYSQMPTKE